MSDKTYYVKCATQEERDSLIDYAISRGAKEVTDRGNFEEYPFVEIADKIGVQSYDYGDGIQLTHESFRRKVRKLWPIKVERNTGEWETHPKIIISKAHKAASKSTKNPVTLDRVHFMATDTNAQVELIRKDLKEVKETCDRIEKHLVSQDAMLIDFLHKLISGQNTMMENDIDTHAKLDTSLSGATFMQELAQVERTPEGLQPGDYTDASKEVADKARVIARTEHRSLTAHVNLLIEEDLRKRQRKTRKP
jgi:hypothetical protein